jgi:rRNA maturation protein Nop10
MRRFVQLDQVSGAIRENMSGESATISIDCPGCGKRYNFAAQHAGRKGKCKSCGTGIVVPMPAQTEPEDIYDMADDVQPPPRPIPAIPVTERSIAAPRPAAGPVLSYSGRAPARAKTPDKRGDYDPYDHFEGNRLKNLYFPLILIVGTAVFNLTVEMLLNHDATKSISQASIHMVTKLAVEIPCMLIACLMAVKLLDAAFGPVGPAILKLSSIALAPDAVMDLLALGGLLIGGASGNLLGAGLGFFLGLIIGWPLSIVFYFWLFMYYFDLDFSSVWKLAIFIWFIRLILVSFITAYLLSALFHYHGGL